MADINRVEANRALANCPACAGRGYRVKWNNGRGRTTNCCTCNGTGKRANTAGEWNPAVSFPWAGED